MKEMLDKKMSEQELDVVAGGMGYCYWAKVGNKFNYVLSTEPLDRKDVIDAWNSNGQIMKLKKDANGKLVPQKISVHVGRGLPQSQVDAFVKRTNQKMGGCQYIEFK